MNNKLVMSVILGLSSSVAGTVFAGCTDDHPMETVMTIGIGQGPSINKTLTAKFKGHFVTTDGLVNRNKNIVQICPGTTVDYLVESTVGAPAAGGRRGSVAPAADCGDSGHYGSMSPGDRLTCNNMNLGGRDTDMYMVKAGK